MGAVFNTTLKFIIKDEETFIMEGKSFIETYNANFSLEEHKKLGHDINTAEGIIRIVFADYGRMTMKQVNGEISASNDFNASYGWYGVMENFFYAVLRALGFGSKLIIEPDSGYLVLTLAKQGVRVEEE